MADIREVYASDYSKLALFLSHFEGDTNTPDYWLEKFYHWWDNNPAFSSDTVRGWVLEDEVSIIGFLGNIPSLFHLPVEKKDIVVFSSTTWRVLSEYRNKSMALLDNQLRFSRNSILFNSTPTETVRVILERLQFKHYEVSSGIGNSLLNPGKVLSEKMKKNVLKKLLLGLCFPALKIWKWLDTMSCSLAKTPPNVAELEKADKSFDTLWSKTKSLFSAGVRSAEVVNWFCFGNRNARKYLFGYYENELLLGYAIFYPLRADNLCNFLCLDLWTLPGKERIIRPLILHAKKAAKKIGCDLLTVLHPESELGRHTRKCFLINRNKRFKVYYKAGADIASRIEGKPLRIFSQGDHGL